jgi:uncharacterized oligopeptide transporter (OPT) family protein
MKAEILMVVFGIMPIAANGMASSMPVATAAAAAGSAALLVTPPVLLLLIVTRIPKGLLPPERTPFDAAPVVPK